MVCPQNGSAVLKGLRNSISQKSLSHKVQPLPWGDSNFVCGWSFSSPRNAKTNGTVSPRMPTKSTVSPKLSTMDKSLVSNVVVVREELHVCDVPPHK